MSDPKLERYVAILFKSRIRTEHEVRERCQKKNFDDEDIKEFIDKLKEMDLVNDKRFAEFYIEDGFRLKVKGPKLLSQELRYLGVERETIAVAMEKVCDELDIEQILEIDFEKKGIKDPKKWINRMIRRGFSYSRIEKITRSHEL